MMDNITITETNLPSAEFDTYVGIWIPGLLCVLGICGNAVALVVLSRDRYSLTSNSLQALATIDLLLLLSALMQQVVPMLCLTNNYLSTFCLNQGYVRVYSWPMVCTMQMASVWLTVLISAERYIAIVFPLRASHVCTVTNIRVLIATIIIASIAFNCPKFFEFTPAEEPIPEYNLTRIVMGPTPLRSDPVYRYLYNTVLYGIVIYAFPLLLITRLNLTIIRKIKRAKENWRSLNRTQKKEVKATVLPLMIVLVYFISGTQAFIVFTLDSVFLDYPLWLQIYTAFVNILVILTSAVNFILLYIFGRKFRILFLETFMCKGRKTRVPISSIRFV